MDPNSVWIRLDRRSTDADLHAIVEEGGEVVVFNTGPYRYCLAQRTSERARLFALPGATAVNPAEVSGLGGLGSPIQNLLHSEAEAIEANATTASSGLLSRISQAAARLRGCQACGRRRQKLARLIATIWGRLSPSG
jgi:hypothetical protein